MGLTFTPLRPHHAAECSGVDIGQPLTAEQAAEIEAAMDRYAVLVFRRATPMNTAQQLAFTRNFGELEGTYRRIESDEGKRLDDPALSDISNLGPGDRMIGKDDRRRLFALGNQLWHSDSSYKKTPAKFSLLHAHVVPPEGGNTEVADMRAAWDALDGKTQARLKDLVVEHSRLFSKGALGFPFTEDEVRDFAPVPQRLVRYHPRSGRRSLFLSSHAGRIHGMQAPEALMLLRNLTEHATQREFVYSHEWRVGDLLMWDNRSTMHRAREYDDLAYPRDLRRSTLRDVAPTLEQQAA
jgi:alpha-ketoglutarate-dependent 2,4-dichlorophenoxyacetate dioxygenase